MHNPFFPGLLKWVNSVVFALIASCCFSQSTSISSLKWVDSILHTLNTDSRIDIRLKSDMADSAFQVSQRLGDECRQVRARVYQSVCLDFIGLADSALTQLYWARENFPPGCDSLVLMNIYSGLTNSYLSMEELGRVDSTCRKALSLWNPAWKDNTYRYAILNNQAIAQVLLGDTVSGTNTFRQIYNEALLQNDKPNYRRALINLGTIKAMADDLDSAYYFFNASADPTLINEDIVSYLDLQYNLANIEINLKRYKEAGVRLDSLYALSTRRQNIDMQAAAQNARSKIYVNQGNFRKAYSYLLDYITLHDQSLNEERVKAVTEMMEKYESEKKARQIEQLKVENLDANLKNEQTKNTRNRYLYSGVGILLFSIGLWTRLRNVRRSRKAIQAEKNISEGLLLNILPAPVAEELKQHGHAKARLFPHTTILFSDFKGFTEISGEMDPEELVEELNTCFQAFDAITTRYGLEKIKTIGDAYMAAGSIPETNKAGASEVVHAALAMQQFIKQHKLAREEKGLPAFEMRAGIHSGPVVAGIVGAKKFQYDIWGDTVNIASRMETNGEPGRVNISATTFELVKKDPSFVFTARGMIYVKGKGDLPMYFAEHSGT